MAVSGKSLDAVDLFALAANGTKRLRYRRGETIFAQGADADAVFYIEEGVVKTTYVSRSGKEGVVRVFTPREFFGISSILGHAKRRMAAIAVTACSVLRIEKRVVTNALRENADVAQAFISRLVDQRRRYEEVLMGHLFHSSEGRLARTLLRLSILGDGEGEEAILPKISQETLAEIVGTTRSRINYFMKKFRRIGAIKYDAGHIRVSRSELRSMLPDLDE